MDKDLNIFQNAEVDLKVNGGPTNIGAFLGSYDKVILKPNKKGSKNVLEQWMLSAPHTKYVIKYDFTLEDTIIEMPDDAILEIDCGSLQHGTLVGKSTGLINTNKVDNALVDVILKGTWNTQAVPDKPAGDGMGKIYLKQGVPLSEQITKENTIYVVQYDFELDEDITIPENCILEFDGGSINLNNNTITGTLQNDIIDISNFIISYNGDCTKGLNTIFAMAKAGATVHIPSGTYNISNVVEVPRMCHVIGDGNVSAIKITAYFTCIGLILKGDDSIVERIKVYSELDYATNHNYNWGSEYNSNADTGIMVLANRCLIENVNVSNLRQGIWLGSDIYFEQLSNNTINNCIIERCAICISAALQKYPNITNCSGSYITYDAAHWPPHFVYFTDISEDYSEDIHIENINAKQIDTEYMSAIQLKKVDKGLVSNINADGGGLFTIQRGTKNLVVTDCNIINCNSVADLAVIYIAMSGGGRNQNILFDNIKLEGVGSFIKIIDSDYITFKNSNIIIKEYKSIQHIYASRSTYLCFENIYVDSKVNIDENVSIFDISSNNCSFKDIQTTKNILGRFNFNGDNNLLINSFSKSNCTYYSSGSNREIVFDDNDINRTEEVTGTTNYLMVFIKPNFKRKTYVIGSETTSNYIGLIIYSPFRDNETYALPNGTSFIYTFINNSNRQLTFSLDNNAFTKHPHPYNGLDFGQLCLPAGGTVKIRLKKYHNGWCICEYEILSQTNNIAAKVSDKSTIDNPLIGSCYFDTSITPNRPVWWNGTAWVDATGATV